MQRIVIIDFGSQYTRNIKARLRRLGYDADIINPYDDPGQPAALFLSGSRHSIYKKGAPQLSLALAEFIFKKNVPTIGFCYGMNVLAAYAAKDYFPIEQIVKAGESGEYGKDTLEITHPIGPMKELKGQQLVWMSHGDQLALLPPGFQRLDLIKDRKNPENSPPKAIAHNSKLIFGLQFHPEVKHTVCGEQIFKNFLELCGITPDWNLEKEFTRIKKETMARIGDKHVIAPISTGNDSATLAWFLIRIVPKERLHFVYFSGVGPQEDLEKITLIDKDLFTVVDIRKQLFKSVENVVDPEEKRAAFRRVYREAVETFVSRTVKRLGIPQENAMVAQGTIWPDVVESQGKEAGSETDKIKSHHNVGIFEEMKAMGNLLEPFLYLFKDELREFGTKIGMPERLISQHPWPGPGYLVRFLCCNSSAMPEEELYIQTMLYEEELQKMCRPYGYGAWILPIKSTGVQGDERSYAYTAALIGPYKRSSLLELATYIPNKFKGKINRVVRVVMPKDTDSLAGLYLKEDYFTPKTRRLLVIANERIFVKNLRLANLYHEISQAFVAISPLSFSGKDYTAIIRAVNTDDFMTASPFWLPEQFLSQTSQEIISKIPEVQLVLCDLTSKPPGTIEWE